MLLLKLDIPSKSFNFILNTPVTECTLVLFTFFLVTNPILNESTPTKYDCTPHLQIFKWSVSIAFFKCVDSEVSCDLNVDV